MWFLVVVLKFLIHNVSGDGIKFDPQKIEVVKNCPRPLTSPNIKSFLDLDSYYRWFVERFSSIASPLSSSIQKTSSLNGLKFMWRVSKSWRLDFLQP